VNAPARVTGGRPPATPQSFGIEPWATPSRPDLRSRDRARSADLHQQISRIGQERLRDPNGSPASQSNSATWEATSYHSEDPGDQSPVGRSSSTSSPKPGSQGGSQRTPFSSGMGNTAVPSVHKSSRNLNASSAACMLVAAQEAAAHASLARKGAPTSPSKGVSSLLFDGPSRPQSREAQQAAPKKLGLSDMTAALDAAISGSSTAVMWSDSNNDSKQFLSNASERSLRPVGKSNQSRAEAMNADLDAQIAAIRMGRSPALTQEACELGTAASKSATTPTCTHQAEDDARPSRPHSTARLRNRTSGAVKGEPSNPKSSTTHPHLSAQNSTMLSIKTGTNTKGVHNGLVVKQGESRQSKPFAGSGLFYSSDEEEEDNDTDPVHPPNAAIKSEWNDVPEGVAREDEPMPRPTSWLAKGGTAGVSVVAQLPYVPYMGSSVVPQSWAREWRKNADVETLETSAFEVHTQPPSQRQQEASEETPLGNAEVKWSNNPIVSITSKGADSVDSSAVTQAATQLALQCDERATIPVQIQKPSVGRELDDIDQLLAGLHVPDDNKNADDVLAANDALWQRRNSRKQWREEAG